MDKEFSVEHREDHIRIELGPDFEVKPEYEDAFWQRLGDACQKYDTRRVLVEGFVPNGERTTDEIISAGRRTSAIPHLWLAFHLENFERNEQSELYEVIAASSGVRVKFFSDAENALRWLRANTPK
ncbi:MAG: hypothetical protein AB7Q37_12555 [Pyrinomonadaceae bacterium]